MFLNLKSKKYIETITNPQTKATNHPKTHRQEVKDRSSKQHQQTKSYRQHQNTNHKRQVGSTAGTTLQPSNSTFTHMNPQFKIKIKEPSEKDSLENLNNSQQKIDSYRLARVTSAYRKIKKIDVSENNFTIGQQMTRSQEKIKRTIVNKSNKRGLKKQMLSNIVQNYMNVTEADQDQSKIMQKLNSSRGQILQQLMEPFIQLFSQLKAQKMKQRSYSHRQLQVKRSLDRNGKIKKNSNEILIKQDSVTSEKNHLSIQQFIISFYQKLGKAKHRIDTMSSLKKYKYLDSPSINMFSQLYQDIDSFVTDFYQLCLKKMDLQLKQYEQTVIQLQKQQKTVKIQLIELQKRVNFEKQKSKMLEKMVINYQDKCLYSTIFMNQLSFSYDVDTYLRQKLFEQAKKNCLISSHNSLSFIQPKLQITYKSQGTTLLNGIKDIYDNNHNQFIGYNIAGFGNCIGAKEKNQDNKQKKL